MNASAIVIGEGEELRLNVLLRAANHSAKVTLQPGVQRAPGGRDPSRASVPTSPSPCGWTGHLTGAGTVTIEGTRAAATPPRRLVVFDTRRAFADTAA